jgi:hypothetical protein
MVGALRSAGRFTGEFPIRHATRLLQLAGKRFPSWQEAGANLARARAHYEQLRAKGAPTGAVRTAECTVFGAEEVLALAKAEQSGEAETLRQKYRSLEIQILSLGGKFIAAWPGEFFVEYGLQLKRRAARATLLATMANGELQGYVVTPEAEAAGGYEAQMSLFSAAAGAAFVEATVSMIEEMT